MAIKIKHQNEQRIAHCQYSNSGAQINNVNTNCFLTSLAGCAVCLMTGRTPRQRKRDLSTITITVATLCRIDNVTLKTLLNSPRDSSDVFVLKTDGLGVCELRTVFFMEK